MPDQLKDIPISWYAAGLGTLTTFFGGLGWKLSGVKVGRMIQKVDSSLEAISTGQDDLKDDLATASARNSKHFEKIYDRMGEFGERLATLEGQIK